MSALSEALDALLRLEESHPNPCSFCQGPVDPTAGTSDGRRHTEVCPYWTLFGDDGGEL